MRIVAFDEIPYDWRVPGTLVEIRPTYVDMGLLEFPARGLIIAQKLAAGSATPLQLYRITRETDGSGLCGAGSIGDAMVRAAREANRTSDLWLIAVEDLAGGTAATGKLAIAGTGAGELNVYIAGRRARIVATAAMDAAAIAAALVAAINADARMPVTAAQGVAPADNEVLLTAKHKGESGNAIDIRLRRFATDAVPAGITVTITAMASGAGNPDIADVIDAIGGEWFTEIATPWTDSANLAALAEELRQRYLATATLDGHAYAGARGTLGELSTIGEVTNSPHLTIIGAKASPTPPWEWAASLMGVALFNLTNDPARQLRTLLLPGVIAPAPEDRFTDLERDLLLRDGISTFTPTADGGVVLERVITTYRLSALNVPDEAWLDVMVPHVLTRIRWDWAGYVSLVYPRHKLAPDNSVASTAPAVVTPNRMKASWAGRCRLYAEQAWLVNVQETVARSQFAIDESDKNRMNARQEVDIIGNLMVLAAALEFRV